MDDDERRQAMRQIFGREVDPAEIVSWTGLEQQDLVDANVSIRKVGFGVEVQIEAARFECLREYKKGVGGKLVAKHGNFEVFDTGQGLGAKMFGRSVDRLRQSGFSRIDTYAAGNYDEAQAGGYNGYYTWPRLGYDSELNTAWKNALPPNLKGAKTVLDLFKTPEGQEWWKRKGDYIHLEFDLAEDSSSTKVLDAYLDAKGLPKRGDAVEPGERRRRSPGSTAEEIDLNAEEEAALERAWAKLRAGQ